MSVINNQLNTINHYATTKIHREIRIIFITDKYCSLICMKKELSYHN